MNKPSMSIRLSRSTTLRPRNRWRWICILFVCGGLFLVQDCNAQSPGVEGSMAAQVVDVVIRTRASLQSPEDLKSYRGTIDELWERVSGGEDGSVEDIARLVLASLQFGIYDDRTVWERSKLWQRHDTTNLVPRLIVVASAARSGRFTDAIEFTAELHAEMSFSVRAGSLVAELIDQADRFDPKVEEIQGAFVFLDYEADALVRYVVSGLRSFRIVAGISYGRQIRRFWYAEALLVRGLLDSRLPALQFRGLFTLGAFQSALRGYLSSTDVRMWDPRLHDYHGSPDERDATRWQLCLDTRDLDHEAEVHRVSSYVRQYEEWSAAERRNFWLGEQSFAPWTAPETNDE